MKVQRSNKNYKSKVRAARGDQDSEELVDFDFMDEDLESPSIKQLNPKPKRGLFGFMRGNTPKSMQKAKSKNEESKAPDYTIVDYDKPSKRPKSSRGSSVSFRSKKIESTTAKGNKTL